VSGYSKLSSFLTFISFVSYILHWLAFIHFETEDSELKAAYDRLITNVTSLMLRANAIRKPHKKSWAVIGQFSN
jgi:hypothetical protein